MTDGLQLIDAQLDRFLILYYSFERRYSPARGYPSTAAGCSQYRVSRQYDDENGQLDADADRVIASAVQHIINTKMEEPYRTAITVNARNLYTGNFVWLSPRLPQDRVERNLIIQQARRIMIHHLIETELM
jgi:hypothetical protein